MGIIILAMTVTAILLIKLTIEEAYGIGETIGMILFGCVIEAVVFFITLVIVAFISDIAVSEDMLVMAEPEQTKIVALKDNFNKDGSFFLGCGSVDDKLYYYYAEETEHGYSVNKMSADSCYIAYTDGEPYIERQSAGGFKNGWNYILLVPTFSRTTIYVPPGTIDTSYDIDLE